MDHCFQDIPGWFDIVEGEIFQRILPSLADGAICVEVGSWLGRSTAFFAIEILNSGKKISLHSVDTWRGSPSEPEHLAAVKLRGGSLFPDFWKNICDRKIELVVQPHEMTSVEAAHHFKDRSVDFAFIDAEHTFEAVRSDVHAWLPKIKAGGTIAGHDADRPMVIAAVQDVIPASRIVVLNKVWSFKVETPSGEWISPAVPNKSSQLPSHLLFIPCVNRPDLLNRAVESIATDGVELLIIDNSDGKIAGEKFPEYANIFRASPPLTFTQTQNFAIDEAKRRGVQWLIFMHNDAVGDLSLIPDLLRFAVAESKQSRVGVIFTAYDAVVAFNLEAVRDVGAWDETWKWYHSDVDYYRRVRLKGWSVVDSPFGKRVQHEVSSTLRSQMSQSIKDDESYAHAHYVHKWGGINMNEKFVVPYNGNP